MSKRGANDDIFDEGASAVPADKLEKVTAKAEDAVNMELTVANLEESLSSAKARLNHLKTVELPDMMAEAGLAEFRLASGAFVRISDFVSGSLPKEEDNPEGRRKALGWLAGHEDGEKIIKTVIEVQFGRNEHNAALDLAETLREAGHVVSVNEGVHPQTLMAFAREALRDGEAIPLDTLGLITGRVAKIEVPGLSKKGRRRN